MTRIDYVVEIPLSGTGQLYELCRCDTPESAASVLCSLLHAARSGPTQVTVRTMVCLLPPADYSAPTA